MVDVVAARREGGAALPEPATISTRQSITGIGSSQSASTGLTGCPSFWVRRKATRGKREAEERTARIAHEGTGPPAPGQAHIPGEKGGDSAAAAAAVGVVEQV